METSFVSLQPEIPVSVTEFHKWMRASADALARARQQSEWAREAVSKMIAEHVALERDHARAEAHERGAP